MELQGDALAGIAGLFGGLTRPALHQACEEVIFRETGDVPEEAEIAEWITAAIDSHCLVVHRERDAEELLVPGPSAFPNVPSAAEDLPHILNVPTRSIDRETIAEEMIQTALVELAGDPSADRREHLRQLSYDLETWAAIDASSVRVHLDGDQS